MSDVDVPDSLGESFDEFRDLPQVRSSPSLRSRSAPRSRNYARKATLHSSFATSSPIIHKSQPLWLPPHDTPNDLVRPLPKDHTHTLTTRTDATPERTPPRARDDAHSSTLTVDCQGCPPDAEYSFLGSGDNTPLFPDDTSMFSPSSPAASLSASLTVDIHATLSPHSTPEPSPEPLRAQVHVFYDGVELRHRGDTLLPEGGVHHWNDTGTADRIEPADGDRVAGMHVAGTDISTGAAVITTASPPLPPLPPPSPHIAAAVAQVGGDGYGHEDYARIDNDYAYEHEGAEETVGESGEEGDEYVEGGYEGDFFYGEGDYYSEYGDGEMLYEGDGHGDGYNGGYEDTYGYAYDNDDGYPSGIGSEVQQANECGDDMYEGECFTYAGDYEQYDDNFDHARNSGDIYAVNGNIDEAAAKGKEEATYASSSASRPRQYRHTPAHATSCPTPHTHVRTHNTLSGDNKHGAQNDYAVESPLAEMEEPNRLRSTSSHNHRHCGGGRAHVCAFTFPHSPFVRHTPTASDTDAEAPTDNAPENDADALRADASGVGDANGVSGEGQAWARKEECTEVGAEEAATPGDVDMGVNIGAAESAYTSSASAAPSAVLVPSARSPAPMRTSVATANGPRPHSRPLRAAHTAAPSSTPAARSITASSYTSHGGVAAEAGAAANSSAAVPGGMSSKGNRSTSSDLRAEIRSTPSPSPTSPASMLCAQCACAVDAEGLEAEVLQVLAERHARLIEDRESAFAAKVAEMDEEHRERARRLSRAAEERLKALSREHERRVRERETAYAQDMAAFAQKKAERVQEASKAAEAAVKEAEQQLVQQREELRREEREVAVQLQRVRMRREKVVQAEEVYARRAQVCGEREGVLGEREALCEAKHVAMVEREAALQQRGQVLNAKMREVEAGEEALRQREDDVKARWAAVKAQTERLDDAERDVRRRAQALRGRAGECLLLERELAMREEEVRKRREAVEEAEAVARAKSKELQATKAELDREREGLERQRQEQEETTRGMAHAAVKMKERLGKVHQSEEMIRVREKRVQENLLQVENSEKQLWKKQEEVENKERELERREKLVLDKIRNLNLSWERVEGTYRAKLREAEQAYERDLARLRRQRAQALGQMTGPSAAVSAALKAPHQSQLSSPQLYSSPQRSLVSTAQTPARSTVRGQSAAIAATTDTTTDTTMEANGVSVVSRDPTICVEARSGLPAVDAGVRADVALGMKTGEVREVGEARVVGETGMAEEAGTDGQYGGEYIDMYRVLCGDADNVEV